MAKDKAIADGVLKTAPVKWQELEFLQSANFKDLTPEGFDKLKTSILQNDFCETFKVWENGKKIYCLDGFHRCKALESLKADGYAIPEEFQASFIKCKNKGTAPERPGGITSLPLKKSSLLFFRNACQSLSGNVDG